jgi:alginate O-acetyltransferase complex protein AlgJ
MPETDKTKLIREEIAKREIGVTDVSAVQKLFLSLFFLLVIGIYPCLQFVYSSPLKEFRPAATLREAFKQYETAIEDTSLLRAVLLTPAQEFLTRCFRAGNEKVIVGRDGWLFYSGDFEYLANPGFLQTARMHKRELAGTHPDPVAAIGKFADDLAARGIRLIVVPVPGKPLVYGDKLGADAGLRGNKSFAEFKERLEVLGVTVLDFTEDFLEMRREGTESYLKTDTHWAPEAMRLAARKTAEAIGDAAADGDTGTKATITARGDIANMLKLPDVDDIFPRQTVEVVQYDTVPERGSEVLLLGDSFANIYSFDAMGWGARAGFAETLAHELGRPIDVIARNDAGAHASRDALAGEFLHGRDRLEGKKVVVWEFAVRELVSGDWTDTPLELAERGRGDFLVVEEPRTVTATVLAVTSVPRPNSAPYKDHVMSLHLGDIDGSDEALAFAASMRDNVWTDAARLRIGDTVEITLKPWADFEAEYGSWNRSEFDDVDLLLQEPCWGELATDRQLEQQKGP